jgi:hypothetical protein
VFLLCWFQLNLSVNSSLDHKNLDLNPRVKSYESIPSQHWYLPFTYICLSFTRVLNPKPTQIPSQTYLKFHPIFGTYPVTPTSPYLCTNHLHPSTCLIITYYLNYLPTNLPRGPPCFWGGGGGYGSSYQGETWSCQLSWGSSMTEK